MDFIDLKAQQALIRTRIDAAIQRVLDHGQYVMGPEVAELERQLRAFSGARHALTCANGTDALTLALMAEGIGPGDTVIVPSFTFIATAEAPAQLGATPYFVDVIGETFNIDPASAEVGIADARQRGLNPRALIVVDLFGQPAEYRALREVAERHGIVLIADAAQSFGATYDNDAVGRLADYTTTSFFPDKPLGCYGDGGAVFTEDDERAARLASLRNHGMGADKYNNVRVGLNSRLDTTQAAVLIEKIAIFPAEIELRDAVARSYGELLPDRVTAPRIRPGLRSVWAQYTILVESGRDRIRSALSARDIPTQVYYPVPMHRQPAYQHFPSLQGGLPVSDALAGSVLSLPFHPYLSRAEQEFIAESVASAAAQIAA